ncbi:hypothetical protein [Dactylosporangium sp. CA-139066]|uniref:hypothetical protein n=1 Tax=Dactylosporangium sp. CA-139066 TaxID=3239930 RepID=UPI003D92D1F1
MGALLQRLLGGGCGGLQRGGGAGDLVRQGGLRLDGTGGLGLSGVDRAVAWTLPGGFAVNHSIRT